MAPFLFNHQELLHKWIHAKETALSKVLALSTMTNSEQSNILKLINQAYNYSLQWKVNDELQSKRIKEIINYTL